MAEQQFRVVVRLVEDAEAAAIVADQVLVGIEQVGAGVCYCLYDSEQAFGRQFIVVVEEAEIVAVGQGRGGIGGAGDAAIGLEKDDPDPLVSGRPLLEQRPDVRQGAAVIGETELPVGIALVEDGADAVVEVMAATSYTGTTTEIVGFCGRSAVSRFGYRPVEHPLGEIMSQRRDRAVVQISLVIVDWIEPGAWTTPLFLPCPEIMGERIFRLAEFLCQSGSIEQWVEHRNRALAFTNSILKIMAEQIVCLIRQNRCAIEVPLRIKER